MKYRRIKISSAWMQHRFTCNPEYIQSHCKGRCCRGTDKIMVSLLPEEEKLQRDNGYDVRNGFLQADPKTKMCPHQASNGLCRVHGTELKPFGCIASPFTLNKNDTLIIRYRFSLFKCHGSGDPAHITFKTSLDLIFGIEESDRICKMLHKSRGDFAAKISEENYLRLKYLIELTDLTLLLPNML